MKIYKRWNVSQYLAGIVVVLTAGCIAFGFAAQETEIPDHSGFQSCQECHADKQSMWEASNHGKAIRRIAQNSTSAGYCSGCHSNQRAGAGQPEPVIDEGGKDSYHRISCLACHGIQNTQFDHRVVVDPEKLCDVCHSQRAMFWGKGAKGIEDSRNFHSGVPCVSCHMTEGNHRMGVLRPDDSGLTEERLDTCTACHMDNNREARVRQIQEWQLTYEENMAPLLEDVKAVEAALKESPGRLDAAMQSKLEDVKANLALLEKDGSRGFHNFVFSLEITSLASADLKAIKAAIR